MNETREASRGARALAAEISRRKRRFPTFTYTAAARMLRVPPSLMHYWLTGGRRPNAANRIAIEAWSEGRVPASAWLTQQERGAA